MKSELISRLAKNLASKVDNEERDYDDRECQDSTKLNTAEN